MANLLDYVEWRGDLSFDVVPFNELDAAIFSQLALIDLDKAFEICPNGTIKELFDAYLSTGAEIGDKLGLVITNHPKEALEKISKAPRYMNLKIHNYWNEVIDEISLQFCAMQIDLNDKVTTVIYSGTDDTLAGWQENFEMILPSPTSGQLRSIEYLKNAIDATNKDVIVIGHSKGGNLTIYSTLMLDDEYLSHVIKAYSFDGPGLVDRDLKLINRNGLSKLINYVPQSSVVGRIFHHPEEYICTHSNAIGVMQHDVFSWDVKYNGFDNLGELNDESLYFDYKLKQVVNEMDEESRYKFIGSFFKLLYQTDSESLTDFYNNKKKLLRSYLKLNKEERDILSQMLSLFTGDKYMQSLAISEMTKANNFKLPAKEKKKILEYLKNDSLVMKE